MAKLEDGCVKPVKGPIAAGHDVPAAGAEPVREVKRMQAQVGKEAPDFEATAFLKGRGFEPVTLSSYKGRWIVLCFYPGDFTFV
jgi:hypothetical protein